MENAPLGFLTHSTILASLVTHVSTLLTFLSGSTVDNTSNVCFADVTQIRYETVVQGIKFLVVITNTYDV